MKRIVSLFIVFLLTAAPQAAVPQTQAALKEAAGLYFASKQEEALAKYVEISKTSQEREAFLNAAYIALELGNVRLATDIMATALKLFPGDTAVLEFAGQAYLASGYYLNAENIFARLSEKSDKTEFYFISLARAQIGMNQLDLAEVNLRQAASGANHIGLSNFLLGGLYDMQNRTKEAAEAYKKACDYDSQFIEAKKRYGAALAKLRRYDEAWKAYSNVLAVERGDKETLAALSRIKPFVRRDARAEASSAKLGSADHTHVKRPISYDGELPLIRVGLGAKVNGAPVGMSKIRFSASHDFEAVDAKGKTIARGKPGEFWAVEVIKNKPYLNPATGPKKEFAGSVRIVQRSPDDTAHTTIIKDMLTGHGMTWLSRDDKEYRGEIEFVFNKKLNGLIPINTVNIEEYVFGVVAAEMPSTFPVEALKTQATIARTYAMKSLGKHRQWGYDVCDAQHCQVYGGVRAERERTNAATEATMGAVLTYKKKPIEAVFSSNCGGFTQSSREAGWFPNDYLQPVSDYKDFDTDNLQPYHLKELLQQTREAYSRFFRNVSPAAFRWSRYVDEEQLRAIVKAKKDIGEIKAVVPLKRGISGYVNGVRIVGARGDLILNKENEIKRSLALGMLRSTYFMVEPVLEKGAVKAFIFYGGGWGHGVGLCQTGTGGRAEAGQAFDEILKHYYTGAQLTDIRK
jgi:SpoIID/LytB domain protein